MGGFGMPITHHLVKPAAPVAPILALEARDDALRMQPVDLGLHRGQVSVDGCRLWNERTDSASAGHQPATGPLYDPRSAKEGGQKGTPYLRMRAPHVTHCEA